MLNGASLAAHTAACNVNNDIEFACRLRNMERLLRNHPVDAVEEILFDRFFVDSNLSRSRS